MVNSKKKITLICDSYEEINLQKDSKTKVIRTGIIEDNILYYINHKYKEVNGCVTVIR